MGMKKLNVINFLAVFFRSFFIQTVWNYQSMLSIGFCFAISPVGKKLFRTPEKRKEFLNRHLNYFNAHPYFSSYVLGAIAKIEEELADQDNPDYNIMNRFKTALIGPLGAIGDQLFWATLKPASIIIGLIGVIILQEIHSKLIFIIIILVMYNIPHMYIRVFGIIEGYKYGFNLYKIINIKKYKLIKNIYGIFGTAALGVYAGFSLLKYGSTDVFSAGFFVLGMVLALIMIKLKQNIYNSILLPLLIGTVVGFFVEYL